MTSAARRAGRAPSRLAAPELPHTTTVSDDAALAALGTPIFDGRDIDCAVSVRSDHLRRRPRSADGALLDALRPLRRGGHLVPVGEVVADSPERLRAIARAGHEIGNHSWSHPQLTTLDEDEAVDSQITRTAREVERVIGTGRRWCARPTARSRPG